MIRHSQKTIMNDIFTVNILSYCVKGKSKISFAASINSTTLYLRESTWKFVNFVRGLFVFNNINFCGKLLYTMFNFVIKNKLSICEHPILKWFLSH